MKYLLCFLLLVGQSALAAPQEVDDHHWQGVERIIAIGDIHGDYAHYVETLEAAGLINARGKWIGGETHLVQTGDIPDRGPDTTKIIQHLQKLAKQADKKGGRVHALIGNHEAMNVYGDLRYVSPGEYQAFVTRKSDDLRDRYYDLVLQNLQANDPEAFAKLGENYREEWNKTHPLGWVEHRQAWDPAWNPEGEYAQWVLGNNVVVQVNDLIFLHGGLSGAYCKNTLQSLTDMTHKGLRNFASADSAILEDEYGPLWYRGLSGQDPKAPVETVDAILNHHNAAHIVVGHTPTSGVIWPRYDGKVIQIDTGISAYYGGHVAYLEITDEGLFSGYPNGKVKLPENEAELVPYLEKVIALSPGNTHLQKMLARLTTPAVENGADQAGADKGAMATDIDAPAVDDTEKLPICGISQ